jgi:hypothetical protein
LASAPLALQQLPPPPPAPALDLTAPPHCCPHISLSKTGHERERRKKILRREERRERSVAHEAEAAKRHNPSQFSRHMRKHGTGSDRCDCRSRTDLVESAEMRRSCMFRPARQPPGIFLVCFAQYFSMLCLPRVWFHRRVCRLDNLS